MNINSVSQNISEDEALDLYYLMARRFGWTGLLYVRGDVQDMWDDSEDTMTDEQWEAVRTSKGWSRMGEWLSEDAFDCVRDAIEDAKLSIRNKEK